MVRFQFLPHYCKYLGIGLYLIFGIPNAIHHFIIGFNDGYYSGSQTDSSATEFLFPDFFYGSAAEVLTYIAIIIYALAKDKVFDELMIKLRLESIYIIFFGTILIFLGRLLFNIDATTSASYLIEAQVICFIILNSIRKRLAFG